MTDRRKYVLLLGLIVAALVGSLLLIVPGSPVERKPTLGLDLQGGLEVVLRAVPPKGHQVTPEDLSRSKDIMENRINKLGVSEPDVRTQPPDQIVIQLAGIHDPEKAAALIGQTAQLEFFDFEADVLGPSAPPLGDPTGTPVPSGGLYALLTNAKTKALAKKGTPEEYWLFKTGGTKKQPTHSLVTRVSPAPTKQALLKRYGGEVPKGFEVLTTPAHTQVLTCPATSGCLGAGRQGVPPAATYYYLVKYRPDTKQNPVPEMTGRELKSAAADFGPQGGPIVTMQFTGKGARIFETITKREADRGSGFYNLGGRQGDYLNYAQHFAIVLDREIRSTPYIDFKRNPDGIAGGNAEIDLGNGGTIQEAKDLALVLQTGALPLTFQQIERTDVSATLGKSSLRQAWEAAAVGLAIVAIFLLLLYRFLGLVAVIGLAIYAIYYGAVILGILPGFKPVLTLPGFAGVILTIGVAADANVVVFERIKEEVRAGKSVRAAISAGYAKGFHTILDANVVTAITALILFAVATAQVRGFAAFLLIGTVISLVTAVAATRAMLGLLGGFRWFSNARFMGASGAQRGTFLQIDFMGKRRLWFAISGVFIVIGAVALGARGLNLGIDFKGGTQMSFRTEQPQTTKQVTSVFAAQGRPDAVVQGRGSKSADRYTQFQVRTKHLTNVQQTKLVDALDGRLHVKGQPDVKTVSASFGRQITQNAILAIIVSMLLIVVYIWIRFDFKFAIPVILAMLHDVVITIGFYALIHREVSTATVAAVLTVLGYSIYDTIIIFDRVRENVPLMRRAPFATIVNVSLWETIRRSLATTFITLLPVGALLVLGGATLKDFAFALLVGVTSGAYSSIFIAAPLLTIWKEREPEYARRKGQSPELGPDEGPDGGTPARRRPWRPGPAPSGADLGPVVTLEEATAAAAAEPAPSLPSLTPQPAGSADARERRRQRRRARPHGRPR